MATKKTFTAAMQQKATNPTLQFISQASPEEQPKIATEDASKAEAKRVKIVTEDASEAEPKKVKIIVEESPELKPVPLKIETQAESGYAFLEPLRRPPIRPSDPEAKKISPSAPETKSRRLQLLIQPSLHEAIRTKAQAEGLSVNELIHSILEAAIRGGR